MNKQTARRHINPEDFNKMILDAILSYPGGKASAKSLNPKEAPFNKTGQCSNQEEIVFTGFYDNIKIDGCKRIRILDARAKNISISGSDVIIENTEIKGGGVTLSIRDSEIILTNVDIEADVMMRI